MLPQHNSVISVISATHLSVERQDCLLFHPISFGLKSGELLWIQGPNGVGKSSLLRGLCGFLPIMGEIQWRGDKKRPLDDIAYLGHHPGLRMALTVWENVVWDFASDNASMHALQRYGLGEMKDMPAHKLSRGQCQRVALAKLAGLRAPIWILDEPFTALDKHVQAVLQEDLAAHCARGGIAIVASHARHEMPIRMQQLELEKYG